MVSSCSIFQGLPEPEREGVVKSISSNVVAVFSECEPEVGVSYSNYSAVVGRKVEYLEALMENFKLGEAALRHQLPTGKNTLAYMYTVLFFIFDDTVIRCSVEVLCSDSFEFKSLQLIQVQYLFISYC